MPEPKPPRNEPAIRVVMMPRDTNAHGTIFGGVILSYIDQAAFVEARRQASQHFVTVMMNQIEFKKPVYVGDVLAFYAHTTKIGSTSIHIHVDVVAERYEQAGEPISVTQAEVVFVAIDRDRRPTEIRLSPPTG